MGSGCAVSSSTTAYNADNEQTKFGSASSMTYDADGELKSDGTNLHLGCAPGIRRPSADSSVYDALGLSMRKTIGTDVTQIIRPGLNRRRDLNGPPRPGEAAMWPS